MNYIGDHPLNLIGKVAIVTSASSKQGAAICRELLNSNALVLGVDSIPAHKSTQTSRASHFQFFQYDPQKSLAGTDVLEHTAKMYMRDDVDYFIDVVGSEEAGKESGSQATSVLDSKTEAALKEHMQVHSSKRDKGGYSVDVERDIASLAVFLCTKSGDSIGGALIRGDGSCIAL